MKCVSKKDITALSTVTDITLCNLIEPRLQKSKSKYDLDSTNNIDKNIVAEYSFMYVSFLKTVSLNSKVLVSLAIFKSTSFC